MMSAARSAFVAAWGPGYMIVLSWVPEHTGNHDIERPFAACLAISTEDRRAWRARRSVAGLEPGAAEAGRLVDVTGDVARERRVLAQRARAVAGGGVAVVD